MITISKRDITPLLWFIALSVIFIPFFSHAQTINTILQDISEILNTVIPILMILATLLFLWGIIQYITAAGDEEKLKGARQFIIWGLIGLFVMVAVWGLVNVLLNTFGVSTPGTPIGPQQ